MEGLRIFLMALYRGEGFREAWREARSVSVKHHLHAGISLAAGLVAAVVFLSVTVTGAEMMAVTVNGQVIGYVNDEAEYATIVQSAKEKISKENGNTELIIQDADISLAPKFVPGDAEKIAEAAVNEDKLAETLLEENVVKTNIYALNVEGEEVATFGSLSEATDALNGIVETFETTGATLEGEGAFKEEIAIESKTSELSDVPELDDPESAKERILTGNTEQKVYAVGKGDTLESVSLLLGVPQEEIVAVNPEIDPAALKEGDLIRFTETAPLVHYETSGVETAVEPIAFGSVEEKSSDLELGERETKTAGIPGQRQVTRNVTRVNGEIVTFEEISSEVLSEPVDEVILVGTKPRMFAGGGDGPLGRPLASWTLTRSVQEGHTGADMCAPQGTPIYAAEAGTVTFVGMPYGAYGNFIKIDHGGGLETWYAHCDTINVSQGDQVARGQQIATVGITGRATAYHLHFEVRVNGAVEEPMSWLSSN
ncbi:MAG: M23 family metallopeptidase [Clostridiales Family XIII bacterium]|nr:M23 family metallopeptidase [Clostridiales Family XIII bacterium]